MHYLSAEKIGCKRELFEVLGKQHEPVWMQCLSLSFGLLAFVGWPRTITLDEIGISQRSLFGIPRTIPYNEVEFVGRGVSIGPFLWAVRLCSHMASAACVR